MGVVAGGRAPGLCGPYLTRSSAGTDRGRRVSVRRASRANCDGTHQRRKYIRQPTQIPVAASSVWRPATAAASSQPSDGQADEERDRREREERATHRLGEARRVFVLGLRRAEPQRAADQRPGAAGQEQAGPEGGRDQQVQADEGGEPGQVEQERDGQDDGGDGGAEALAARVDEPGGRGREGGHRRGSRSGRGRARQSGAGVAGGCERRCGLGSGSGPVGRDALDCHRRPPATGAPRSRTGDQADPNHARTVARRRLLASTVHARPTGAFALRDSGIPSGHPGGPRRAPGSRESPHVAHRAHRPGAATGSRCRRSLRRPPAAIVPTLAEGATVAAREEWLFEVRRGLQVEVIENSHALFEVSGSTDLRPQVEGIVDRYLAHQRHRGHPGRAAPPRGRGHGRGHGPRSARAAPARTRRSPR